MSNSTEQSLRKTLLKMFKEAGIKLSKKQKDLSYKDLLIIWANS